MNSIYILHLKKPHRLFNKGDIVIGSIVDGGAERMVVYGYSTKIKKVIKNFSLRYQGWREVGDTNQRTGAGHLKILYEVSLPDSFTTWYPSDEDIRATLLFVAAIPRLKLRTAITQLQEKMDIL